LNTPKDLSEASATKLDVLDGKMDESFQLNKPPVEKVKKTSTSAQPRNSSSDRQKQVSFGHVVIHEHPYIPGDNPGGSVGGPPVSIDWDCQHTVKFQLESFERTRPPRRCGVQMRMPADVRDLKLRENGYSRAEITKCLRAANVSRAQRARTIEISNLECRRPHFKALIGSNKPEKVKKERSQRRGWFSKKPEKKENDQMSLQHKHRSSSRIIPKGQRGGDNSNTTIITAPLSSSFGPSEELGLEEEMKRVDVAEKEEEEIAC
jgi:hypothetical protein